MPAFPMVLCVRTPEPLGKQKDVKYMQEYAPFRSVSMRETSVRVLIGTSTDSGKSPMGRSADPDPFVVCSAAEKGPAAVEVPRNPPHLCLTTDSCPGLLLGAEP
jgi:hypothetical protein